MVPSAVRPFPHDGAHIAVIERKAQPMRANLADRFAPDIVDIL
jgi:hypothetical protein